MTKGYARFITVLFCLFLGGLMVWQAILPDRERSDVENRTLAQMPELTVSGVLDGTYMEALEEYVQDQFPLRDGWTGMKARAEQLLGKQLFNNVYLCGDTLISKVDAPGIPVYLGLIPSAAEIWADKLPAGAQNWDQVSFLQQAAGLGVPMVDFAGVLTEHAGEEIFYRTDHHWTSLGAYYGYTALMEALGRADDIIPLDAFDPETVTLLPVGNPLADTGHHGVLRAGGGAFRYLLAYRRSGGGFPLRPQLSCKKRQVFRFPGRQSASLRHP